MISKLDALFELRPASGLGGLTLDCDIILRGFLSQL